MKEENVSKGGEALARLWADLPEDVRASVLEAAAAGLDATLVVLSARLATTDFAKNHESFPKLLGTIVGRLRDYLRRAGG